MGKRGRSDTEAVKVWALSVCAAAVFGAAVNMISPGEKHDRLLKLLLAAMLISTVCSPLARLDLSSCADKRQESGGYISAAEQLQQTIERQSSQSVEKALSLLVREELDKMGISPQEISFGMDRTESGSISIEQVTVRVAMSDCTQRARIKQRLTEALGLEVEVVCQEDD